MIKSLKCTLTACTLIIFWGIASANLPAAAQVYTQLPPLGGGAPLRGVVLGGEGGQEGPDYHGIAYAADTEPFLFKGFNTFDLPVTWEALANGNVNWMIDKSHDNYYYKYIIDFITNETKVSHAQVIFDLYNFFRYNAGGGDGAAGDNSQVLGSGGDEPGMDPYVALWMDIQSTVRAIEAKNNNPDAVIFKLMNTPYFFPENRDSLEHRLADYYFSVIDKIHQDDPNRIFIVDSDSREVAPPFKYDGGYFDDPIWVQPGPTWGPIKFLIDEINNKYGADSSIAQSIRKHIIIEAHDNFYNQKPNYYHWGYGIDGCADKTDYMYQQINAIKTFCNEDDHKGVTWMLGQINIPDYNKDQTYNGVALKPVCKKDMETALQYAHTNEPTFAGFTLEASGHSWGPDFAGNFSPGTCKYTGDHKIISYLPSDTLFDKNSYLKETVEGTRILNDLPAILWPKLTGFAVKYIIHNKSNYTLNIDSDSGGIVEPGDNGAGIMARDWRIPYCNHVEPLKGTISMPDNNFDFEVNGDMFGLNDDGTKQYGGNEIKFNIGKPQLTDNMGDRAIVINITNGDGHHPKPPQDLPDIPSQPYTPESAPYPGLKHLHAQSR